MTFLPQEARRRRSLLVLVVGAALAVASPADGQSWEVGGNVTAVGQATTSDSIRNEVVSSVDLFFALGMGRARLHAYVEANTTPFSGGVSRLLPGANADAGTALNARGTGRIQISELRFAWPLLDDMRAHVGLVDATGFIDVSRIANDENLFFLGRPFVNNPTIAFPDYTLGVALEGAVPVSLPLTVGAVVSRSLGVADDPCACYGPLFDLNDDPGAVFLGTALRWEPGDERISLGGWIHTSRRPMLDGSAGTALARGVFAVLGHRLGAHSISVRAGLANADVLPQHGFVGVTYLVARPPDAVGVALGRTFTSASLPGVEDVDRAEAFVRRRLFGAVFATVSVQRIANGGSLTGPATTSRVWVAGARLSAQF